MSLLGLRALCVLRGENCFPLSERAGFCGHSEFCPSATAAFAASASGVQRLSVPLGARAAGRFAGGEDLRQGGSKAAAAEFSGRLSKPHNHLNLLGGHEKVMFKLI